MKNGKTIKQIADELGVSKQAVHQKRKRKVLSTALHSFTTTVDGVVYISVDGEKLLKQAFSENERKQIDGSFTTTVDGEKLLKQAFSENERKQVDGSFTTTVDGSFTPSFTPNDEILAVLKATIDTLQKQLDVKDKQIEELIATNKAQAQSINADRYTELADRMLEAQEPKLLKEGKQKKKWQFWK